MGPYGDAGKAYVQWCAKTAVAQNIGVPWIMCQQADAPSPVVHILIYLHSTMLTRLVFQMHNNFCFADQYVQWILL